jgi:6-phosphogluconolactonase (cycloisomerase 2 family)
MGRFVYVANQGSNNLSGFRLNPVPVDDGGPPAGGLSVLPDSPFAMGAGTAPSGLAIDPSGRYLYVALGSAHEVAVFVIDPASGALTRAQAIRTRASPRGIAVAGGGTPATVTPRFAYTANSASDDVSAYSIDPSAGTLASAGRPAETGPTPAVITASPGGDLLVVLTQGSITSFAIDAESGDLTLGGMAPMSGSSAAVFGVSADQTLYVTNASASSLDAYSVGGYYVSNFASASTGTGPTSVAVSPTGRFLYVTNGDANTVSAYSILQRYVFPPGTSAGTPSPIGSPLATGTRPSFIAVHPAGRFAYVLNQGSDSIAVYNIHPSTGLLTSASSTPAGRGPTSMGISPSGRHAWVLNRADLTVQAFSIDLTTGALTAVENGILELGGDPVALTVDDAGRFVYVTSRLTEEMAVLAIDPATGLLGPVSVARLGSAPSGAAVVSSTE